jgi:hypothetical protein
METGKNMINGHLRLTTGGVAAHLKNSDFKTEPAVEVVSRNAVKHALW